MYRTKYLVIQDLDEFVVPMRSESWQSMLDSIANHTRTDSDRIASYNFRSRFFPINLSNKFNLTSGGNEVERRFKTLSVTKAGARLFSIAERSKVMARPERVVIWHVHLMLNSSLVRGEDKNVQVDPRYGQLFHYKRGISVATTTAIYRMNVFESRILRRLHASAAAICLTNDYLFP